ncbi:hypothetical protein HPG69_015238 [Diceros bicornis minor]|uniref:Uncharacterized protein n=1 Tax=Diceros bicornis minor TaxID=77932 RepID=A0A7J7EIP7_DICBM|nr:hypothetical protein HPG69_015238 [Diceros bicornis minor]
MSGDNEEQEEEAVAATGYPSGFPEAKERSDVDLDTELKTEGAWSRGFRPVSSPWGLLGRGGGGRLRPRGQAEAKGAGDPSAAESASLRGTPSGQPAAPPASCPPRNALGSISCFTIRTRFQNDVKIQKPSQTI